MDKKFVYLLIAIFLSSFIVIQSCNESPLTSSLPGDETNFSNPKSAERLISYKFGAFGPGLPVKCAGQTPSNTETRIILWGNNGEFEVGWIEFDQYIPNADSSFDSGRLHVIFHFNYDAGIYPWYITKVYFHVGDKLNDIPHNNNGVTPEKCNYVYDKSDTIKTGTHSFWYNLPDDNDNDGYYIFANAVGCHYGGVEGFNMYLPKNKITYQVTHNSPNSYFKINFLNGSGGILTGPYQSNCVDPDNQIFPPINLTGRVYSSYDTFPAHLKFEVDNWQNLDIVNWLINNYPVGSSVQQRSYSLPWTSATYPFPQSNFSAPVGTGIVTWVDIQAAIWAILDNSPVYISWSGLSNLIQNNAWGIVYDALYGGNHNGFVPGCNQKIMAILVPDGPAPKIQIITIQPTISQLQIPCVTHCGSICGDGKYGATYPGINSTYTYFRWDTECSGMP